MALSTDQYVYIRRQTGSTPSDSDLNVIYTRVGNVDVLVLEVLETRYANLLATPASFTVVGDYSQSTGENLKALAAKIKAWRAWMLSQGLDPGPTDGSVLTFQEPITTPWR